LLLTRYDKLRFDLSFSVGRVIVKISAVNIGKLPRTLAPRKVVYLLFVLIVGAVAQAKEPAKPKPAPLDEGDVVRINTNVVQVDASVVDKNGKFVTDLRAEDFEITEEGKKVELRYFSFIPLVEQRTENIEGTKTTTFKPIKVEDVKGRLFFW